MKHTVETHLNTVREKLVLSSSEKALHRAKLTEFMGYHPAVKPVRSPLSWVMAPAFRYSLAALLMVTATGSGVAFAAEDALPGTPLYAVKTKMVEPVQVALTLDAHSRADLRVELADRRLKEFAQISQDDEVAPETTAEVAALLEEHVSEAAQDIVALQNEGSAEEALQANADLQSTLVAHSSILKKVQEENPESSDDIDVITAQIDEDIADTEVIEVAVTESLADETSSAQVDEQEQNTQSSLDELSATVIAMLTQLDEGDRVAVEQKLLEVDSIIAEARTFEAAGDEGQAFVLFNQAEQELLQLTTLLEAEQQLDVDILE